MLTPKIGDFHKIDAELKNKEFIKQNISYLRFKVINYSIKKSLCYNESKVSTYKRKVFYENIR